MATVADTLEMAADKLEPEGAWTQGVFARDRRGRPVRMESANAVCFCAVGALYTVGAGREMAERCALLLASRYRVEKFADWNDHETRTQAEVVSALRAAAAKAREVRS